MLFGRMPAPDHYAVLGVEPTASAAEIKAAFRRAAKEAHPDRSDSEDAAARFRRVNEAYRVLSDPEQRRHFDWLRSQRAETGGRSHSAPAPRNDGASNGEGTRRRRHRDATATQIDEMANENLREHAAWLDDLVKAEVERAKREEKSRATLYVAGALLILVAAWLIWDQLL
jgi:curved DNA-binding protein CbpA